MAISIRRAEEKDVARLLAFVEEYYGFDGIPFDAALVAPAIRELLSQPGDGSSYGCAWLAESSSGPVGYCILTFGFDVEVGGRFGLVTDLYLKPELHGRGFGRQMLETIEAKCREVGARTLQLESETSNHAAHAFYRKAGFEEIPRQPFLKRLQAQNAR